MAKRSMVMAVLGCLTVLAIPVSANMLNNSNFEVGGPHGLGFHNGDPEYWPDGWLGWGSSGYHHDDNAANGYDPSRTIDEKAVKLWWDDSGLYQDFAAVGGMEYDFSVQVLDASSEPCSWNGVLKAEFYDASNGQLAVVELEKYMAGTSVDQWYEMSGSVVAPENTSYGRIVLTLADYFSGVGGALNFDNAAVTPEPGTLALLGLAGLAVIRRR